MIRSFRNKQTEDAFNGIPGKGFPSDLIKIVRRKLGYLNAAALLAI